MKHKHHDIIVAWAVDTSRVVQWKHPEDDSSEWLECINAPAWKAELIYRFKPEPKPDIVIARIVEFLGSVMNTRIRTAEHWELPNVSFTFDGETHKLKSVRLRE